MGARDATVTGHTAPLSVSMPAVSRLLKVLERDALISRSRAGKWGASHLDAHLAAVQAAGPAVARAGPVRYGERVPPGPRAAPAAGSSRAPPEPW
ncbi:hypothetical protein MRQ36_04820 [Micromonospora sp. R77]|nr:hypothetical protein [Micromonospora sp. R77]MCI4061923.1 hypothetical protein [Micromonospora sp. R77]